MDGPGWCVIASNQIGVAEFDSTSPRLRGEVGIQAQLEFRVRGYRSINWHRTRGESPSPRPSPREERGEGEESSILRTQLSDFRITREIIRTLAVHRIHHHALAVLQRGLADIGP